MKTQTSKLKFLILLVNLACFVPIAFTQNNYNDGHNQFSKINGKWVVVDSLNNPIYDVDSSMI